MDFGSDEVTKRAVLTEFVAVLARLLTRQGNKVGGILYDGINLFVVPTVMILLLHASAFQVGLVSMAQYLAIPVLSLVAGMLVDRWDLRWTLVGADLIRFVVIAALERALNRRSVLDDDP